MKKIFVCLLCILCVLFQSQLWAQIATGGGMANITIRCKSSEHIPLNYYNRFYQEQKLFFTNQTKQDLLLNKEIYLDMPIEIQYRLFFKNKAYRQSFLLRPGVNAEFLLEDHLLKPVNSKCLIPQDCLDFYNDFAIEKPYTKFTSEDFKKYYKKCNNAYSINLKKVDSMYINNLIDKNTKDYFTNSSSLDYYYRMLAPVRDIQVYNNALYTYLNPRIADIKKFITNFELYKTDDISIIIRALAKYDAIYQNANTESMSAFVNYIYSNRYGNYSFPAILNKLNNYENKNGVEVLNALESIKKYTSDSAIIKNIDSLKQIYGNRNISHPENIKFVNYKKQIISLKQILAESKGKILVIDLWATWCIPCRQQTPVFNQFREKFKGKNIRFINISMDDDKSDDIWLNIINKEDKKTLMEQYRLTDPRKSYFTAFYAIKSIPRYFLFNAEGELVNETYYLPTEKGFESTLLTYFK